MAAFSSMRIPCMLLGLRLLSVLMVHHTGAACWVHEACSALFWPCIASQRKPQASFGSGGDFETHVTEPLEKLTKGSALQVLDSNVRRGSAVFERGHFLVLAMAGSQRDRDVLWQLLTQVNLFSPDMDQPYACLVMPRLDLGVTRKASTSYHTAYHASPTVSDGAGKARTCCMRMCSGRVRLALHRTASPLPCKAEPVCGTSYGAC